MGRRGRRSPRPRRPWRGGRGRRGGRPASGRRRRRPGSESRSPRPLRARHWIVHGPISLIASSRRSSPGSPGSQRPEAISRAALTRARARFGARSQATSSAGASAATTSGPGTSASGRAPAGPLRAVPQRCTIRRWIRAASRDSISCSVTAQANASQGFGQRRTRSQGNRRISGPQQRVGAEAALEVGEVVVDGEGVAGAADRLLEVGVGRGLRAGPLQPRRGRGKRRDRDPAGARLRPGADEDRPAGDVHEPLVDAAAMAGDAVGHAASEPVDPERLDLDEQRAAAVADRRARPGRRRHQRPSR